ncbi:hypothetical protein Tco_0451036 [Tanacetum coccineum]
MQLMTWNKDSSAKLTGLHQNVTRAHDWLAMTRGMTRGLKETHSKWIFCTKTSANKTHMLQRSRSAIVAICVIDSNPTASREDLMIGNNRGFRLRGASNKLEDIEASISGYKYKSCLSHKNNLA